METNHKHIDLEYLKQISNGSNEFIFQMITVFNEEIPGEIANLEKHLQAKDWKSLRATAHKMKPSYSFMGVKELEELINSLEEDSNDENIAQVETHIKKIHSVTDEVIAELKEEMQNFK